MLKFITTMSEDHMYITYCKGSCHEVSCVYICAYIHAHIKNTFFQFIMKTLHLTLSTPQYHQSIPTLLQDIQSVRMLPFIFHKITKAAEEELLV